MRTRPDSGRRRAFAVGALLLALAGAAACDAGSPAASEGPGEPSSAGSTGGDTTGLPGDSSGLPHDTVWVPGDTVPSDTTWVPGDTIPGDTTGIPGDTTGIPGDTTGVPGDTIRQPPARPTFTLLVDVSVPGDSVPVPVAGAVVVVTRPSGEVVASDTTGAGRYLRFTLSPGTYGVALASFPGAYQLSPGESPRRRVTGQPRETAVVTYSLVRR